MPLEKRKNPEFHEEREAEDSVCEVEALNPAEPRIGQDLDTNRAQWPALRESVSQVTSVPIMETESEMTSMRFTDAPLWV